MNFTKVEENHELYSHENTILAIISNATIPPETPDYTVNLKTVDISELEFLQLFFNYSTNHFHINPSNSFSKLISLKDKEFITNANQLVQFNFNQFVVTKIAEKEALTNSSLTALNKLTASKRSVNIHSLAQVRGYQQALTWYETMDLLLVSNIISQSSNPLAVAEAGLVVQFIFVEPSTNLSLAINYNYNVSIPGYSNVHTTESTPFTYSKDESITKKASREKVFSPPKTKMQPVSYDEDDDNFSSSEASESVKMGKNSSVESLAGILQGAGDDEDSIGFGSITNSIMQQIKLVQQESSSEGDNESLNDDSSTWA